MYGQSIDFNKDYYSARREALYRVLIESDILMKSGRLGKKNTLKLYYNKTGKRLFDTFPAKNVLEQGDVLFSLLFKFAAGYVIKNIHAILIELKLLHKLFVRVD